VGQKGEDRPTNKKEHSGELIQGIVRSIEMVGLGKLDFHTKIKQLTPPGRQRHRRTSGGPRHLRAINLNLRLIRGMKVEFPCQYQGAVNLIALDNLNTNFHGTLNQRHIPGRQTIVVNIVHKSGFNTPRVPDPQTNASARHMETKKRQNILRGTGRQGDESACVTLQEMPPIDKQPNSSCITNKIAISQTGRGKEDM